MCDRQFYVYFTELALVYDSAAKIIHTPTSQATISSKKMTLASRNFGAFYLKDIHLYGEARPGGGFVNP